MDLTKKLSVFVYYDKEGKIMAQDVNGEDFQKKVLDENGVVVVDFWAAWCPPCRALSPIIEKVGQDHKDKAKVVKLNVDENQDLAMRYGIRGIPTVKMFKDGKEVETIVGLKPEQEYARLIEKHA